MTLSRDDDPAHPNWDGIAFRASTDRKGIIVMPTSAQTQPPYSFLPIKEAIEFFGDLRAVIFGLEAFDPKSYLAHFLDTVATDMAAAIEVCRPAPTPEPETAHAPEPELQGATPG